MIVKKLETANDTAMVLKYIDNAFSSLVQTAVNDVSIKASSMVYLMITRSGQKNFTKDNFAMNNNNDTSLDALQINGINEELNATIVVVIFPPPSQPIKQISDELALLEIPGLSYLSISIYSKHAFENKQTKIQPESLSFKQSFQIRTNYVKNALRSSHSNALGCFFYDKIVVTKIEPTCRYFDEVETKFLDRGCFYNISSNVCSCNHTTVFAVLLAVTYYVIPTGVRVMYFLIFVICVFLQRFIMICLIIELQKIKETGCLFFFFSLL